MRLFNAFFCDNRATKALHHRRALNRFWHCCYTGTWINDSTVLYVCFKSFDTTVCIDRVFIYDILKCIKVCFSTLFCTLTAISSFLEEKKHIFLPGNAQKIIHLPFLHLENTQDTQYWTSCLNNKRWKQNWNVHPKKLLDYRRREPVIWTVNKVRLWLTSADDLVEVEQQLLPGDHHVLHLR